MTSTEKNYLIQDARSALRYYETKKESSEKDLAAAVGIGDRATAIAVSNLLQEVGFLINSAKSEIEDLVDEDTE